MVRRARASDLILREDATSIHEIPFKLWRSRVSFSVDATVHEAFRDAEGMGAGFDKLCRAAEGVLAHPRVCTAWMLTRIARPRLGGAVALALESLLVQAHVSRRWSAAMTRNLEHATTGEKEG